MRNGVSCLPDGRILCRVGGSVAGLGSSVKNFFRRVSADERKRLLLSVISNPQIGAALNRAMIRGIETSR